MLLISPQDANTAIGASCGGSAPEQDDPGLLMVLRFITPRVEGALNIYSLARASWVDHFFLSNMSPRDPRPEQKLLLSNGFLVRESIQLTAPDGSTLSGLDIAEVEVEQGWIMLRQWERGPYSVSYSSGFEIPPMPDPLPDPAPNPEDAVLIGVPDWIKGLACALMVMWFRSAYANPRFPKTLSYAQVANLLNREIYARVYEKYMRPRVAVSFPERMDRGT